ncbi:MAG: hypothetical protein JWQ55_3883 [Rhodopila sp.]|nr:hypothetical protein [Rhodopila sp.]
MTSHQDQASRDERTNHPVPRHIIEALDASLRDIADGNVHDAASVQAEARRMVADYERAQPATPG